jgi:hypothetical protein
MKSPFFSFEHSDDDVIQKNVLLVVEKTRTRIWTKNSTGPLGGFVKII